VKSFTFGEVVLEAMPIDRRTGRLISDWEANALAHDGYVKERNARLEAFDSRTGIFRQDFNSAAAAKHLIDEIVNSRTSEEGKELTRAHRLRSAEVISDPAFLQGVETA
jgi:hypothetical protein